MLIVSAHPYCTCNSLRHVMPRYALSARTQMFGDSIFSFDRSLSLSIIFSKFCEQLKKICVVEV